MKIAILGAGAYGTALGGVLAGNGYDVDYYDPLKERERLKDVVADAGVILLCAPSEVIMRLLCHLPKMKFIVVASKGFLNEEAFLGFKDYAVLAGAGFADDIKAGKTTHLTTTDWRVVEMFANNHLRFDVTDDRLGVLMCGALKNIYAIRAGEMGLKANTRKKEDFIYAVVKEMAVVLSENGAKPGTIRLACGMKDLSLTCGSNSRNYQFGQMLTSGLSQEPGMTVEGLAAIKRINRGEMVVPESAKILQDIIGAFR